MRRVWPVVLIVILGLVAGYASYQYLALDTFKAVVNYHSPYQFSDLPASQDVQAPPLTHKVVIFLIDGLRDDVSRQLDTLNALRQKGADLTALAGQPSLSLPGATVLSTGTWQEISGVTTNWYSGKVLVDSIWAAARRSGLSTGIVAGESWGTLFGQYITYGEYVGDEGDQYDNEVEQKAAALIQGSQPDLMLVHFSAVDNNGHAHGGKSPEYLAAAKEIDARIGRLLPLLQPGTTVVVVADHGHIATGGHGGWEPEVLSVPLILSGPGVKAGAYGLVRQADLVPTLSALLGIPIPAHAVGEPLFGILDASPDWISLEAQAWAKQQLAFRTAEYRYFTGADLPAAPSGAVNAAIGPETGPRPVNPEAYGSAMPGVAQAEQSLTPAVQSVTAARAARLGHERWGRLPWALVALAAAAAAVYLVWRQKMIGRSLLGVAVFLAVFYGLYFGRGYYFSLSVFNEESAVQSFFIARMIDAAVAMILAALVAGLVTGRRQYTAVTAAETGAYTLLLVLAAQLVSMLPMMYLWGLRYAWYIPPLRLGFGFLVAAIATMGVGIGGILSPFAAMAGAKVGAMIWHPERPGIAGFGQ